MKLVDLSRRPFLNERPVLRTALLLGVLASVLVATDLWLFGSYLGSSARLRGDLAEVEDQLAAEHREISTLQQRAAAVPIEALNERTRFLNRQILDRTFPWSRLFEDLEEILPLDVWLHRVSPDIEDPDEGLSERRRRSTSRRTARSRRATNESEIPAIATADQRDEEVGLTLTGTAQDSEAILELVDRLFAAPAFGRPLLTGEARDEATGRVTFNIEVVYSTGIAAESENGPLLARAGETASASPPGLADRARSRPAGRGAGAAGEPSGPDDGTVEPSDSPSLAAVPREEDSGGVDPPVATLDPGLVARPAERRDAEPVAGSGPDETRTREPSLRPGQLPGAVLVEPRQPGRPAPGAPARPGATPAPRPGEAPPPPPIGRRPDASSAALLAPPPDFAARLFGERRSAR